MPDEKQTTLITDTETEQTTNKSQDIQTSFQVEKESQDTSSVIKKDDTAPLCYNCGNQTQRAGSCYVCTSCGSTTGCS